jgi:hypothetical protein
MPSGEFLKNTASGSSTAQVFSTDGQTWDGFDYSTVVGDVFEWKEESVGSGTSAARQMSARIGTSGSFVYMAQWQPTNYGLNIGGIQHRGFLGMGRYTSSALPGTVLAEHLGSGGTVFLTDFNDSISDYRSADVQLLNSKYGMLRNNAGTLEWSGTATGSGPYTRTWTAISGSGSGAAEGPDKAMQFKDGTAMAGSNKNTWDKTLQRQYIIGLTGTAALVAETSFIQAQEGFYSQSTAYNAFNVPSGGMLANNANLAGYLAMASNAAITPSTSDSFTGNALLWYDNHSSSHFLRASYGTGASTYADANFYGAGLFASGTAGNDIQAPNGGVSAKFLVATDRLLMTGQSSPPAGPSTGQAGMYADNSGNFFWWNRSLTTPAWSVFGTSNPGGSSLQVQFNNAGALSGAYGLIYDPSLNRTIFRAQSPQPTSMVEFQTNTGSVLAYFDFAGRYFVTGIAGQASIALTNGYIQSAEGLYTPSASFQALNVPSGGLYAQSLTTTRYASFSSIGSITPTTGDSLSAKGLLWYDNSSSSHFLRASYGTGASTYTDANFYGLGLFASGTSGNDIQAPNGGVSAKFLVATDRFLMTGQASPPAGPSSGQAGMYADTAGSFYFWNRGLTTPAWSVFGTANAAGADTQVQINSGGTLGAASGLYWFNTSYNLLLRGKSGQTGNLLDIQDFTGANLANVSKNGYVFVTGTSGQAAFIATSGFMQSAEGFYSAGVSFQTLNIASGGAYTRSASATQYFSIGSNAAVTVTTGEDITGKALLWYDNSSSSHFLRASYGTSSSAYTDANFFGLGLFASSTAGNAIQAPNGGVTAKFLISTDRLIMTGQGSAPAGPSSGQGGMYADTVGSFYFWNRALSTPAWSVFGTATPAGLDKQVQINSGGVLAAASGLIYDNAQNYTVIRGKVSQSFHLLDFQDSSANVLAYVDNVGNFFAPIHVGLTTAALTSTTAYSQMNAREIRFAQTSGEHPNAGTISYNTQVGTTLAIYGAGVGTSFFQPGLAVAIFDTLVVNGTLKPSTPGLTLSNSYMQSQLGYYTPSTSFNAIQAPSGGVYALSGTLDGGLYLKAKGSSTFPSSPGGGYGAWAHQTGSLYSWYNSSLGTWNSLDLSTLGGSSSFTDITVTQSAGSTQGIALNQIGGGGPAIVGQFMPGAGGTTAPGNELFKFGGRGAVSGSYTGSTSAIVKFVAEETFSGSAQGARMEFLTTWVGFAPGNSQIVGGSSRPARDVRMTITNQGVLSLSGDTINYLGSPQAYLIVNNGYILSTYGYACTYAHYQALNLPSGGSYARSHRSISYTQLGVNSGIPSLTSGDGFQAGATYWDSSLGAQRMFNGSSWATVGGSGGSSSGSSSSIQYANGSGGFSGSLNAALDASGNMTLAGVLQVNGSGINCPFSSANNSIQTAGGFKSNGGYYVGSSITQVIDGSGNFKPQGMFPVIGFNLFTGQNYNVVITTSGGVPVFQIFSNNGTGSGGSFIGNFTQLYFRLGSLVSAS